jgi:hypothetical protein
MTPYQDALWAWLDRYLNQLPPDRRPSGEPDPNQEITLEVVWRDGYAYSELTFEPGTCFVICRYVTLPAKMWRRQPGEYSPVGQHPVELVLTEIESDAPYDLGDLIREIVTSIQ